jgi:5-methylcytosine-specific restriction protein A
MIKDRIDDFSHTWLSDRNNAESMLEEYKSYNAELKSKLISENREGEYTNLKKVFKLSSLGSYHLIVNTIPKELKDTLNLSSNKYAVTGSIGKGRPSDIPWIGLFDKGVTNSAQEGYYIVFLFDQELKGVYLCLELGWTQFEKKFGLTQGKIEIAKSLNIAQNIIGETESFNQDKIDLLSNGRLARGYAAGVVTSKYYPLENFPDNHQIIKDLNVLINKYQSLKKIIGNNPLSIINYASEEFFQTEIQNKEYTKIKEGPKKKESIEVNSKRTTASRDPNVAKEALYLASFKCEVNNEHSTFISSATNHQYVEAHHLIPLMYSHDFEYSLDVPENIISLCPNCHRAFHHAKSEVKIKLITYFYKNRANSLDDKRSITITLDKLKEFYKCNI